MEARKLLARACTQMGYQAESGPWRDFYLTGAQELLNSAPKVDIKASAGSVDTLKAVPINLFFDLLAVRLNGPKAADKELAINFIFPDSNEKLIITVSNGVLNYINEKTDPTIETSITLSRARWNEFAAYNITLESLLDDDSVSIEGDKNPIMELFSLMDDFKIFFNIVEP